MIFSVSNNGFEWSLESGPDSVNLTVKDLVHEKTISSHEILLAAWSFLLAQRQEFLNNHLARIPFTPIQQGTHEMRDKVLWSAGAQVTDTSGCQVSDPNDVEFNWEIDQLDVDVSLDRSLIPPFHQKRCTTWRWEIQQKTPFCSTKRKTRRTLLQPQQSLRDQHDPLHCWDVVHLEWKMHQFLFLEICFKK